MRRPFSPAHGPLELDARVAARPASLGDIGRAFLPASVDFRFWARGQGRNQGRAQTAHAAPAAGAGERRTSRPRHEEDDVWGEVRGASRDAGFSSPATSQSQRGGRRYKAPEEDPWGELSPGRERGRRDDRPHSRQEPWRGNQRGRGDRSGDQAWFDGEDDSYDQGSHSRQPYQRRMTHAERREGLLESNRAFMAAHQNFKERLSEQAGSSTGSQRALQEFLADMEEPLQRYAGCLDDVNVATAVRRLTLALEAVRPSGRLLPAARRLLGGLIEAALAVVPSFRIQAVSQLVCGLGLLADMGSASPLPQKGTPEAAQLEELLTKLAARTARRLGEPPPPEPDTLGLVAWGYSRLGIDPLEGALLDAIEQSARPMLDQFTPKPLANLMVAAAQLGHRYSDGFMAAAAKQCMLKMPAATPQAVANLLMSFAKLRIGPPLSGDLFRAGLSRALESIDDVESQHVANLLWASDAVGHPISDTTLEALAEAAVANIGNASPNTLAALVLSCSKLGVTPLEGRLVLAAVEKADGMLDKCNLQALSNILWGISGQEVQLPQRLLQRLDGPWAERAMQLLAAPSKTWGQNASLTLRAYSRLRMDPLSGRLFQEVFGQLPGRMQELSSQHASLILFSAATLVRTSFPAGALERLVQIVADSGSFQEVCNSMWSLAVLGVLRAPMLASLADRLEDFNVASNMTPVHARQILVADAVLPLLDNSVTSSVLPAEVLEAARRERLNKDITISRFHEEVSGALAALGVQHAIEVASPDGLLAVDILARCGDGRPLAIEADGTTHFTALPPHRPLGPTLLRNRLLAARGFRGLGIPYYDWEQLHTPEQQASYLAARLAKWGIGAAPAPA